MRLATALLLLAACGGDIAEDDEIPCGDAACDEGEFCLTVFDGDAETLSCTPLPASCDTVDQMCFDDPEPCSDDWMAELCPDAIGGGCSGFDDTEVRCDLPLTTTSTY